ncbi:Undecaprenyl-phosphate N-acetylglucosaminyl 1-phosphate transferase [plant metagenome]|uniref:Undecaprenyl-phosphate N-acetylglucosaminyl 1-phosphate transferase n=1 Tax=plant metagenome TaxID=1297885 RepID=A0A484SY38_9ZZZZ
MDLSSWPWWLFVAGAGLGWFLTGVLRRYALARNVLDVPNARSSHQQPTPRGGGLAFVIGFLLGLVALWLSGGVATDVACALGGAGAWIALVGFLDDHGHIQARWRLLAHFAAAAWILAWLGGAPPLAVGSATFQLGAVGSVLAALYLVWLLNLYNFMDGIDGIASVEAICATVGAAVLYVLVGQPGLLGTSLLLGATVAGFLVWNFPPARIFMGDGGSGFLGIVLGGLSLQAGWDAPALLWGWLILLGVFVVDATTTLLRRLLRGEKVYEAHRTHAYQYAARRWKSHKVVTLSVLVINIFWLLPWAMLVAVEWLPGWLGALVAYAPLLALALSLGAGRAESTTV